MNKLIIINSDTFGDGPADLGARLMGTYLRTLAGQDQLPDAIAFYNRGVTLLADDSPVLDALQMLAEKGVELTACGTCLAYYEITDRLAAGDVGDMQLIVSMMMKANTVVTV